MLMERPKEITDEAKERDIFNARKQVRDKEQQIMAAPAGLNSPFEATNKGKPIGNGIRTTQVQDSTAGSGAHGATRSGGSGKSSRTGEEVALVFDKNKGAIYALYQRALRDNPAMQGKVVVELTISPSGDVTAARIVSSELNDPEFESKLLARIRLFKFEARDVAPLTTTKPIDFFPA